jgi:hypothetical protein
MCVLSKKKQLTYFLYILEAKGFIIIRPINVLTNGAQVFLMNRNIIGIPSLAINIVLKKNIFFNCKEHLLLLQYVSLVQKYKTIKNI